MKHSQNCCYCCCSMNWASDKRRSFLLGAIDMIWANVIGVVASAVNNMLYTRTRDILCTQIVPFLSHTHTNTRQISWIKLCCWSECNWEHDCGATFHFVLYINSLTTTRAVMTSTIVLLTGTKPCLCHKRCIILFSPVFSRCEENKLMLLLVEWSALDRHCSRLCVCVCV